MAIVFIPAPGTEGGPCEGNCTHSNCKATKQAAAAICNVCGKPMGYNQTGVLCVTGELFHLDCEARRVKMENNLAV